MMTWAPENMSASVDLGLRPRPATRLGGRALHAIAKVLADLPHLRRRIEEDVGAERIALGVVLVIGLGRVEAVEPHDLGHDRAVEDVRGIDLLDVRLSDAALLVVGGEDDRPILPAAIRALAIARRRVVCDREEDLEQLTIADLGAIESDLDRFGVIRRAARNGLVVGRALGSAGVAADDRPDAVELPVDSFDAPEASTGEHSDLF